MRKVCSRSLVLVLACTALVSVARRTEAQTLQTLIDFTSNWRYDQTGRELGTTWRAFGYVEDSSWGGPGPGLLGFEDSTPYPYPLPVNTTLNISATVTNYYFRNTFSFSGTTTAMQLVATNFIDDGAVIYLNGTEVGRFRVPANQNAATFGASPLVEGQLDVVVITNLALLRQGLNVMAAEVHQVSTASSDIVWGMKLVSVRHTALAITSPPQNQTATVGDANATFSVGVSGGPAFYRWQKDGAFILNATNNPYTILGPISAANAGEYRVIVSNFVNSVTSTVATLTVLPDTKGPEIIDAVGETNTVPNVPIVNVRFSETLSPATARDTNNFCLYAGTNTNNRVTITNIIYAFTDAPRALLKVTGTNWMMGSNYFLVVNNVADSRGNNIDPNTIVAVSWQNRTNIAQTSDTWSFYDSFFLDPTFPAIYNSSAWYSTNYVPDANLWGGGGGIFYRSTSDPSTYLCAGDRAGTLISFQGLPTLFRRSFTLSPSLVRTPGAQVPLRLRYIVDDGAIFYLNGRELFRTANMVGVAPLNENTIATSSVGDPTCLTADVTVTNLLPGSNWLAAAVYQGSANQGDTVFGLEIDATFLSTSPLPTIAPPPYRLTLNRQGPCAILSWNTNWYGLKLQYTTNLTSPAIWQQISNQSNPFTNCEGPVRLFRLQN